MFLMFSIWFIFQNFQENLSQLDKISGYLIVLRYVQLSIHDYRTTFRYEKVTGNLLVHGVLVESQNNLTNLNGFLYLTEYLKVKFVIFTHLYCTQIKITSGPYQFRPDQLTNQIQRLVLSVHFLTLDFLNKVEESFLSFLIFDDLIIVKNLHFIYKEVFQIMMCIGFGFLNKIESFLNPTFLYK